MRRVFFFLKKMNIKLVFSSFKIKNYFSYKDSISNDLKSFLVYKFTCASCSSSYIGETCHFKAGIEEHIKKVKFHIFKHLHSTTTCFDSYNSLCFKIINKANYKFDLKIKEALHINWIKLNLNVQQNHLALTFTIASVPVAPFCLCLFSFCCSLSSIVFIIPMLVISTFYFFTYTLLLLHLFITHLVIDFIITI